MEETSARFRGAGAQPCDMPVRDPSSARRKRTRDAQSAFAELIARDPPPPPEPPRTRRRRAGRRRHRPPRRPRLRPLRSTSSSLDLRLPALGLRAGDVRGPDTQTQTQTVDGRPPSDDIARDIVPRDIAVRDVRDVSDDDESEDENDAVAVEAFGDARALVGGGAGLSPRTLKRNERDLLRALSHSHDGDAARRDVRSTHDASVGGTQGGKHPGRRLRPVPTAGARSAAPRRRWSRRAKPRRTRRPRRFTRERRPRRFTRERLADFAFEDFAFET